MTFTINRLSPSYLLDRNKQYMSNLANQITDAQETAITGLQVSKPSDAPQLWPEIYGVQDSIQDQGQWVDNAEAATSLLASAESALGESTSIMSEARALAVTYGSEVYSAADRNEAANLIDQMREQLVSLANSDVAGRHVFGGTAYDANPFDSVTGAYLGSTGTPETRVGENEWVQTGYDGGLVFSQAIQDLADFANVLRTGTSDDVANLLPALGASIDSLISSRQQVGYDIIDAQSAKDLAENLQDELTERQSDLIAADPEQNLMFSVHMWWTDNNPQRVTDAIHAATSAGLPLLVGEFAHKGVGCSGAIPYRTILAECQEHGRRVLRRQRRQVGANRSRTREGDQANGLLADQVIGNLGRGAEDEVEHAGRRGALVEQRQQHVGAVLVADAGGRRRKAHAVDLRHVRNIGGGERGDGGGHEGSIPW